MFPLIMYVRMYVCMYVCMYVGVTELFLAMTHYSSGGKIVESERYIWNTKDRLGTGATGAVYSGYHKVYSTYIHTVNI